MNNDGRRYQVQTRQENPHVLLLTLPFGLLAEFVHDPDPFRRRGRLKGQQTDVAPTTRERHEQEMREEVQREFKGAKKANLPGYRTYIEEVLNGTRYGTFPKIVLWTDVALTVEHANGVDWVVIPRETPFVALDGETQLAARFDLMQRSSGSIGGNALVEAELHHGIFMEQASQCFADLNTKGVTVPAALAHLRDRANVVMKIARRLAEPYPGVFNVTGYTRALSLNSLRQAVLWSALQKLDEPKRPPVSFSTDLAEAESHLRQRLAALVPLTKKHSLVSPAVFVACTDEHVTVADIEATNWELPMWRVARYPMNAKTVKTLIAELRHDKLPFNAETAGVDATTH